MAAVTTSASTAALHAHDAHAGHDNYATQLRLNRLGLWLFFISEAFLFGALLATRFFLWGADTRPELDQTIGLIVTSVLLISSISMRLAETALERGNRRMFSIFILLTALFGTIFLGGVMVFEWGLFPSIYPAHLTPWDNKYGAVVFAMTGMHAHCLHPDRLEPGAQGQLHPGAALGRRGLRHLLALRRCRLDFLLSGALPDWKCRAHRSTLSAHVWNIVA